MTPIECNAVESSAPDARRLPGRVRRFIRLPPRFGPPSFVNSFSSPLAVQAVCLAVGHFTLNRFVELPKDDVHDPRPGVVATFSAQAGVQVRLSGNAPPQRREAAG